MTIEKRMFGIPGSGKTTWLASVAIPDAAEIYGPENILVTSFTRTGAKEIATKKSIKTGQSISIPSEQVGTLHSICFHALSAPKIIETDKKLIAEWNERYPNMAISGKSAKSADGFDEVMADESDKGNLGDQLLSALNIKRNRMLLDKSVWNMDLRRFEKAWTAFKDENVAVDFTDLIEICLKDRPYAPNMPSCMFVDEAQDCTKLQLALARSWALNMEELVLCGDDEQSIFSFSGASHDAFLEPPIPDEQITLLEQSYRLPVAVLDRARALADLISKRQPKKYYPRKDKDGKPVQGSTRLSSASYRKPEEILDEIADMARAGRSIMVLATCSYMLEATKRHFMNKGIPYANPYRRTRKDWNPLYIPERKNGNGNGAAPVSHTVEFLHDFLSTGDDGHYWTIPQFVNWCQHIKVGEAGLKRKIGKQGLDALREAIAQHETGLHTSREVVTALLEEKAVERALARDRDWFTDQLKAGKGDSGTMDYALKVVATHGVKALTEPPNILTGTVHSVKGGQAETIVLFPDISWQADAEMQASQEGCDRAFRVMYVGMTRAYEELVICAPSVKYSRQSPRMFVPM